MRNIFAFTAGSIFGLGLLISGMTDTRKVIGWLDVFGDWNPSLAFVMAGGILPMALAWRYAKTRNPALGGMFPPSPNQAIGRNLVAGSILFGAGWGLSGLCPGPAVASLSFGGTSGIAFLVAMCAGMWMAPHLRVRLDAAGRPA